MRDDARPIGDPARRQRQHGDDHRVALQGVPLFATEEREVHGHRIVHRRGRNDDASSGQRKDHLVSDGQVHPAAADEPRCGRRAGRGPGIRPHSLRSLERQNRHPTQARAQLAREPRRRDDVELRTRERGVAGEDDGQGDAIALRRRRCGGDQAARHRAERRRGPGRHAVHGHRDRLRGHGPPTLAGPHGPDHQGPGPLGAQPEFTSGRPRLPERAFDRYLGNFARADDREPCERRQREAHRFGRARAGSDGQGQQLARREPDAVHPGLQVRRGAL